MLGKKVLLIGLDLRKHELTKSLNSIIVQAMSTYLSGNCEFEEVISK